MTSFLDRLLGRPEPDKPPRSQKAVTALGPWANGVPLSMQYPTPQEQCKATLRAYSVGWFYKAGKRIADDVSSLDWTVSLGDVEEGDRAEPLPRPDLRVPFAALSPIDQLQRLLERPNPSQTGRQLLRKTQVRLDFAGTAFWYLENAQFGLPTAIYGISPSRMWPSYDRAGNLIGWVMDKDAPSGGVPFEKAEILLFTTGNSSDDDIWGVSVVDAVKAQVPLTEMMARHTGMVLSTGGRLAGMMWPKERALTEDEFLDAQRAWRNVASDPEAGKRLLIFPEPMEYASGASTPAEIGIPELATLNRDEILTAFPLSPYMLGVPTPGGLNSGEVRREDRRDYWEGTIHPRADLLEETLQVGLVSFYEQATGQTYDLEIEEPNLDDASSITAKADAYKALVSIGFDPKDSVAAVGLDGIKWNGLPALLDPVNRAAMAEQAMEAQANAPDQQASPPAKATKARAERREQVTGPATAKGRNDLQQFFSEQRARVVANIREKMPVRKADRKADPDLWWDDSLEDEELSRALRGMYTQVGRGSLQVVADELGRVIANRQVARTLEDLLTYGGQRITGINDLTKAAIAKELAEGTRRGYSISQIIDGVPSEGYGGVQAALLDNGVPVFGDIRAETIARTETALSYNRAAVTSYKDFGVQEVLAYDGDDDEECRLRNGNPYPIDEALEIEDHPNGTLDWAPIVDKAYHDDPKPVTNVIGGNGMVKVEAYHQPSVIHIVRDEAGRAIAFREEPIT